MGLGFADRPGRTAGAGAGRADAGCRAVGMRRAAGLGLGRAGAVDPGVPVAPGAWRWLRRVAGAAVPPAAVLGVLVAGSCARSTGDEAEPRLRVVATTGMIADAARAVGGNQVRVTGLMGPGVDPHLYKAREGDVRRLAEADLVLFNGLHLEAKMGEVLERVRDRIRTVPVTRGIEVARLLAPPEFEGAYDPHVWFDVGLWREAAAEVRDALIEVDGANAAVYRVNGTRYLEELAALDAYVRMRAASLAPERRVLITAHDAFNYFGRAYGFEVRGLQGISTAAEAGTADVQGLAQYIVARRIPAIFVESSIPVRTIEAVQAAVGARGYEVRIGGQLYSDALGDAGTPEGTYVGMVRHNIDTIVDALARDVAASGVEPRVGG